MRILAAHFWRLRHGFGGVGLLVLAVIIALLLPAILLSDEKRDDKSS
jgi:hypothetical protein